jgi:secondary thiamine-phosphate synthase enzyme
MAVEMRSIVFSTEADTSVVDITAEVANAVAGGSIKDGIAVVFVPGSTGAVTTLEHEPGLVQDLKDFFDRAVPKNHYYKHEERWHDNNGYSHVRAALLGPSVTVPFRDKRLLLGTWQQIVFVDFDVRPREREVFVQVLGD